MQGPRNAECSRAVDIAAAKRDVVHDQDAPGDRYGWLASGDIGLGQGLTPLLSPNDSAPLGRRSQLCNIYRNLCTAEADACTIDKTPNNEHGDVLRGADNDRTDTPNDGADLNSAIATESVGEETGDEGTQKRTTGHGCGDTSLDVGFGARAFGIIVERRAVGTLVEVATVLGGSDDGTHRRDVKTKQPTTDDGDGCDEINIADLIHVGGFCGLQREQRGGRSEVRWACLLCADEEVLVR